jgi:hypothetical protein
MAESTLSLDDELKQADLALKRKELRERNAWMKNPAVIAAAITGWVALGTAVFSGITSHAQSRLDRSKFEQQQRSDLEKFQQQQNATIIMETIKENIGHNSNGTAVLNEAAAMQELEMFLDAGLLTDKSGALRKMIEPYSAHRQPPAH